MEEQIALMNHIINSEPLTTRSLDMNGFATAAGMHSHFSIRPQPNNTNERFFWIWNYRALRVQQLYRELIICWMKSNYGNNWATTILNDERIQRWWNSLKVH